MTTGMPNWLWKVDGAMGRHIVIASMEWRCRLLIEQKNWRMKIQNQLQDDSENVDGRRRRNGETLAVQKGQRWYVVLPLNEETMTGDSGRESECL